MKPVRSVMTLIAIFVGVLSLVTAEADVADRFSKGFANLVLTDDYTLDNLGNISMVQMSCTLNAVRCNDATVPCSMWATPTCFLCNNGYQERYCIPDDGEDCVVIQTIDDECGSEQSGNCAGGNCMFLVLTGNTCHPKVCGA